MILHCCFVLLLTLPVYADYQFCMSAPFSGIVEALGNGYRLGIEALFTWVNTNGGIGGNKLTLAALDDGFDPTLTQANTKAFLQSPYECFAFVGYVGTAAVLSAKDEIISSALPLIGAVSGSLAIREPFDALFVNLRPSDRDEALALVDYGVRSRQRFRWSVVYLGTSYGEEVLGHFQTALDPYRLNLVSAAAIGSTTNATEMLLQMAHVVQTAIPAGRPDVIVIVGTSFVVANVVQMVTESYADLYYLPDKMLFLTLSGEDTVHIADLLRSLHVRSDVVVSQVVPNVLGDPSSGGALSEKFASLVALEDRSSVSFEGFVVGEFIVKAIEATLGAVVRPEQLIETIFNQERVFHLDPLKASFSCGDGNEGCQTGEYLGACNDGFTKIYRMAINSTSDVISEQFTTLPTFKWPSDCCAAVPSNSSLLMTFGQSITFDVLSRAENYRLGLHAAFNEANSLRVEGTVEETETTSSDVLVRLHSLDDEYRSKTRSNTEHLLNDSSVFSLLGYYGRAAVPGLMTMMAIRPDALFIAPLDGEEAVHRPFLPNVINFRLGVQFEIALLLQFFLDNSGHAQRIAVVVDATDETAAESYAIAIRLMDAAASTNDFGCLRTNLRSANASLNGTDAVAAEKAVSVIMAAAPEAIVVFADHAATVALFINLYSEKVGSSINATSLPVFGVLSSSDPRQLREKVFPEAFDNIVLAQAVPDPWTPGSAIGEAFSAALREYWEVVDYKDTRKSLDAFEGYLVGRMVFAVLRSFPNDELVDVTPSQFISELVKLSNTPTGLVLGESVSVGPYTEHCNSPGMRSLFFKHNCDLYTVSVPHDVTTDCEQSTIPPPLRPPFLFGASLDLNTARATGRRGKAFLQGLECALSKYRDSDGVTLDMQAFVLDDEGFAGNRSANLEVIRRKKTLGLLGSDASVEMEGAESGAALFVPFWNLLAYRRLRSVVSLKPYLFDEIVVAAHHFTPGNILLLVQPDHLQLERTTLHGALPGRLSVCEFTPGTTDCDCCSLIRRESAVVISALPWEDFVDLFGRLSPEEDSIFVLLSNVDPDELHNLPSGRFYRTQAFDMARMKESLGFYDEFTRCPTFHDRYKETQMSGFLTGHIFGQVGMKQKGSDDDLADFWPSLLVGVISLESSTAVFSTDNCRVFLHDIFLIEVGGEAKVYPYTLDRCTYADASTIRVLKTLLYYSVAALIVLLLVLPAFALLSVAFVKVARCCCQGGFVSPQVRGLLVSSSAQSGMSASRSNLSDDSLLPIGYPSENFSINSYTSLDPDVLAERNAADVIGDDPIQSVGLLAGIEEESAGGE